MWDPYAEFKSATLPNGLMVHAAHWPGRQWEALGFLVHSGAQHDPEGLEGTSHYVEHVVSENTNTPRKEMENFVNDRGGMINLGVTGYNYTYYSLFLPKDKEVLEKAFLIFGHMLLLASLDKSIERERKVIIEEFNLGFPFKTQHDLKLREHRALYSGSFLERFVRPLGDPESIGRITQADLQWHYDEHYTPANMSIVGVGGMKIEELVELLSESPFATSKKGVRTPLPIPSTDVSPPSETRYIFERSKYITSPSRVGGYRSVAKIPGNTNGQAVRIMAEMLSEVLTEEVRERRSWTYNIGCSRHNYGHLHEFTIHCGALALEAIDDIEEVIEGCISSVANHEKLFERVKRQFRADKFMVDPTGRGVCDNALEDLSETHRIISLAELDRDIENVTMNDIRDMLRWLRPERRWTLILKP